MSVTDRARWALLRPLTRTAVVLTAVVLTATPALASGGSGSSGGGGGGGSTSSTPPIQLSPGSSAITSGQSDVIQVVVSPAAPSGGETLSVTASNPSLTVPGAVPISGGSSFGQFSVTGNGVSSATPVTVTVRLGTASAATNLTVNPALAASASTVAAFPHVVASDDAVTVAVSLSAAAPAGGATVGLTSDSTALPLPAEVVVPAGATIVQVPTTAGTVAAATVVHITASYGGTTAAGQVEIDPSRDLTAFVVSPTTDGTKGSTGQVTVSVPADGGNYTVALASSDPGVASVPASVAFLDGQQSASFPISTTAVDASTDVTITASVAGQSLTATLTVVPTPPPAFDVEQVTVSPAVIAGAGTATATVTATTAAPAGGVTIPVSSSDPKLAAVPASVFLPAGAISVSFPVKVPSQSSSVNVGISALFQNRGHSGQLGVTSSKGGSLPKASTANEVLAPRPVNDPSTTVLGFYQGGSATVESGQMPPGISLISPFRPSEFVFSGSPQKAGTYTFVLKFSGVATPYTMAYVWVITPS